MTAALASLLARLNLAGPEQVLPEVLATLRAETGARGARLLFVDVEERVLRVWGRAGQDVDTPEHFLVDGSLHGRVYLTGRHESEAIVGGHALVVPVVTRSERLGVLEVRYAGEPDEAARALVGSMGLLLGYVAVAAGHWTDEFQVARRRQDMTLAAEIQWTLLPLAAFSTERVSVAGALEPAYDIAGDCFDYSCGRRSLSAAIFDAMGHGLAAAQLAALAVTAYRNARRGARPLAVQARAVHEAVLRPATSEGFVTGQIASIDLEHLESSRIVNGGHPAPFLQRDGATPTRIDLEAGVPFGVPFPAELEPQPLRLRSGDRLTLFSDGITEARPDGGEAFSEERLARELATHRHFAPREAARRIIGQVRAHRAADLSDDATILVLDLA
jgi:hypothetical protein